jgi:hypothetical protein
MDMINIDTTKQDKSLQLARLRNEHGNILERLFYPDELIVAK